MNYSQKELQGELTKQPIDNTNLYYSLAKKQAQTLTFLSNDRLLIYDDTRRILFYVNQFKSAPFKTVPIPKNKVSMPLDTCTYSNPATTNQMHVRKTQRNQKGELQTTEWIFEFYHKYVVDKWMTLLTEEKDRLVQERTGQKGVGYFHDTLLEAVKPPAPPPKQEVANETILKPEEQMVKHQSSDIRNSRQSDPRRSNVQPSNSVLLATSQSAIREREKEKEPEIRNSDIQGSTFKPNNPPGLTNSNINYHSNVNEPETKPYNPPGPSNSNLKRQTSNYNAQSIQNSRPINSNSNIRNSSLRPEGQSGLQGNFNENYRNESLGNTRSRQNQSNSNSVDWNLRFLKDPCQATIFQFQKVALDAVKMIWSEDASGLEDAERIYEVQGLRVVLTNCFSREAKILKRQFRNYHFILEACKNKIILGVPMCCLIEWQGVVALVKAPLPVQAVEVNLSKILLQVKQLQRYTRIANGVLEKATLLDTTQIYGPNGDHKLIYVDALFQYLPIHFEQEMLGSSVRPQYMLDSVNQIIPGGQTKNSNRQDQKQLSIALATMPACLKDLAQFLNSQEVLWVDAIELKDIFHSYGINYKLLPRVYEGVGSKQVRRCIQSIMAAKVAKDQAYDTLLGARRDKNKIKVQEIIEDYLKLLMEGNNANSSEVWKELTLRFKKQYSSPISNSEILPGFFLNSLIKLLRVKVDMSKFARGKKSFKEQGIISPGFVVGLDPKVKCYYKFSTQFVEKIRYASRQQKKSRQIFNQIIDSLELKSKGLPEEYQLNNNYQPVCQYLTFYSCPHQFDNSSSAIKTVPIYDQLLKEPPSGYSLRITKSYLQWAIKKQKNDEFKKVVEESLKLNELWLQDGHIFQTDLLQLLSDYYSSQGNYDESINFMKETLSKTIRTCGSQSKKAGNKYYELGQRELKGGRKKQALDSFSKAKANMLANKNGSLKYPLLLMRMASLHLNSGDIEGCIEGAMDSIKQFNEYDKNSGAPTLTEGYKVKTYEVLARAYEISSRKSELKDMALICAKKFNSASMEWAYEQMVRICLAATIFFHQQQRCQLFVGLCSRLQKEQEGMNSGVALKEMMRLSESLVVMEKFMYRFDSLERLIGQSSSKKPMSQDSRDFLMIAKRLVAVVGEDYIEGLVQQKQYE